MPIIVGGKIIGAIGVSGGTGQQDGAAALAGAKRCQIAHVGYASLLILGRPVLTIKKCWHFLILPRLGKAT
jgi:hypothetical protein